MDSLLCAAFCWASAAATESAAALDCLVFSAAFLAATLAFLADALSAPSVFLATLAMMPAFCCLALPSASVAFFLACSAAVASFCA